MGRKKVRKQEIKDILKPILILIIGAALAVASFLVYYLVQPNRWIWLSILFVLDYAYSVVSVYFTFYYQYTVNHSIIKIILVPTVYILIFIAVPVVALTLGGAFELIKNNIIAFVVYAFSTAPCMLVVVAIVFVILYLCSLTNAVGPTDWV